MNNSIVSRGAEIAKFYYSAQRYFISMILLAETAAKLLADKGWKITLWNKSRPLGIGYWAWGYNMDAHLPRSYQIRFSKGDPPNIVAKETQDSDTYGMSLRYFNTDPSGERPWVPTGYFFRVSLLEGKIFEDWEVDPKLSEVVRPLLLEPTEESFFQIFTEPNWPFQLAGGGVDNVLQSIMVVPFPLAAIKDSEDVEMITTKAVQALSEKNGDILRRDGEYRQRVWGIL